MLITSNDSTEQLFVNRKKNIKRTLDVVAIKKDGTRINIPVNKIVKKSFKYEERGSSNNEKIFGMCSNPHIEISFYDIALEVSDSLEIGFVVENLSDDSSETIPLGNFTIEKVLKESKGNKYTYSAYNYLLLDGTPSKFDTWRMINFLSNVAFELEQQKGSMFEMSFGVLAAKCGVNNYIDSYRSFSGIRSQINNESIGYLYQGEAFIDYAVFRENADGFTNPNKLYKFLTSGIVKQSGYQSAVNVIHREIEFDKPDFFVNNEIYPFVECKIGWVTKRFPILENNTEEVMFLCHKSNCIVSVGVPLRLKTLEIEGEPYDRIFEIYSVNSDFIQEAEGHSSEFRNEEEYNDSIIRIPLDTENQLYRGYYGLSESIISSFNYSKYFEDALEVLGKKLKTAKNIPGKFVTEGETTSIITEKLYPESIIYPGGGMYPLNNKTMQGCNYSNFDTVIMSPEQCEEVETDASVYKYSGIRLKFGYYDEPQEKTYFFDNSTAPYHIYDMTSNLIFTTKGWMKNLMGRILTKYMFPKLSKINRTNVVVSTMGNAVTELYDDIVFKTNNMEYKTQITRKTMKGEQFVFEEIESEHADPNLNEETWKKENTYLET